MENDAVTTQRTSLVLNHKLRQFQLFHSISYYKLLSHYVSTHNYFSSSCEFNNTPFTMFYHASTFKTIQPSLRKRLKAFPFFISFGNRRHIYLWYTSTKVDSWQPNLKVRIGRIFKYVLATLKIYLRHRGLPLQ